MREMHTKKIPDPSRGQGPTSQRSVQAIGWQPARRSRSSADPCGKTLEINGVVKAEYWYVERTR